MFFVAAWHNFIGGALFVWLYEWIYAVDGLVPPTPGVHYQTWIGLVFIFGAMYYMIYRDMYGSRRLILLGILGKVMSASPMLYGLLSTHVDVPNLFVVPVVTDFLFGALFLAFYLHADVARWWTD